MEFEHDGSVVFNDGGGRSRIFPRVPKSDRVQELADGAALYRASGEFIVELKTGLSYHFPVSRGIGAEIVVDSIADRCSNYVQFVRNEHGLASIVSSTSSRVNVVSADGLIREMRFVSFQHGETFPLVRYEYSAHGELTAVFDAIEQPYRFRYDRELIVEHIDRNGLSFRYAYIGSG